MAHPQAFGSDGMMMQYGSMGHMQQQQQQMVMHQKRMQLKSQMGATIRPNNGPPPMSTTSVVSQRGISQMPLDMPPQQPQLSAANPQQPVLPCSHTSSMSSQAGLRTTHGLVKRAPSPRRPPPHYTDTVSMQSVARRMVAGAMPTQHAAPEMNAYGADHLRFPMGIVPDYGPSIGSSQMEAVQQFSNNAHSSLSRFPNMPQ